MGILRQEEITVDFKIRSLDVEDPGVEEQVRKLNPAMPKREISKKILETKDFQSKNLIELTFKQNKNQPANVQINVLRQIWIYSNFYFVKRILKMLKGTFKEKNFKAKELIQAC